MIHFCAAMLLRSSLFIGVQQLGWNAGSNSTCPALTGCLQCDAPQQVYAIRIASARTNLAVTGMMAIPK